MTTVSLGGADLSALRGIRRRADGILEAEGIPTVARPSLGQRVFIHDMSARFYVISREGSFARLMNGREPLEDTAWVVRALELERGATVLDIPCGQGNATEALARSVPRGRVVAVDLNDAMLKLARERLERAGVLERVLLVRGNAQDLPLEDDSVDAVCACAGLHLFPDPDRAIAEMRRVLRPGGRVAGLVFVKQRHLRGKLAAGLAHRVLGLRTFDFDELGRRFEANGFVGWNWHRGGIVGYFSARAG